MKKYLLLFSILLFSACQEVGDNRPLLSNSKKKQPVIIVNKNRHLNMSAYWISQLETPDKIIMNEKEIQHFNDNIAYKNKTLNYFHKRRSYYKSSWIKETLLESYKKIKSRTTHFVDGSRISPQFYSEIKENLDLKNFHTKDRRTRFALTVNYTNQKIIPTERELLKKENQIHFDRNQNSALDIATPIAILHTSKDGLWHYGVAPTSSGWVRSKDIAFGEKKEIVDYLASKNFVVTTSAKTALWIHGDYHDYLRMGVRLPMMMKIDEMTMVMVPSRNEEGRLTFSNATVRTENVHKGYLPYTSRTILRQAFKFLHAPYGWGGMYGEQDCSKFIQEIYATTGVKLPRNSASQSDVGQEKIELAGVSVEAKEQFLHNLSLPGATILHLRGHIVLYLGEYKGEPYIIHTVWGDSSRHFALGRTAVTSLNFNDYLKKIDRITAITLH